MKKISKTALTFILGVLLAFTIDVAAETVISSGAVSYSNSKTTETTVDGALDELFSAVDINQRIGTTDISSIGDGTITGAISTLNNNLSIVKRSSVTLRAWKSMAFLRGDSNYISLYVPGVYVGSPGSRLNTSNTSINFSYFHSTSGWINITMPMSATEIWQEEGGIRIISATQGVGDGGVAVFIYDVVITA